ncbi:uncharacterized protein BT62DRAFT_922593 [Guyanagaster necrorhizus]|uniref:Uncharacterized protein n=1 Tax=Guyanagaster necrorhizus TaxID=856835 RepID=A0A9P8ANK3_9AGAR|nr:uncharacterized protein BT62DRAFT_922593 [Guyanagaster necrorhizus MCA 3950]KAG7442398.1 hypothetical protein BT62DRAFT_922593 [Guyanagaster necrorhizus MCA 3950]
MTIWFAVSPGRAYGDKTHTRRGTFSHSVFMVIRQGGSLPPSVYILQNPQSVEKNREIAQEICQIVTEDLMDYLERKERRCLLFTRSYCLTFGPEDTASPITVSEKISRAEPTQDLENIGASHSYLGVTIRTYIENQDRALFIVPLDGLGANQSNCKERVHYPALLFSIQQASKPVKKPSLDQSMTQYNDLNIQPSATARNSMYAK